MKTRRPAERGRVQISLVGLIVLCGTLILATGLITGFVRVTREVPAPAKSAQADPSPAEVPPWGELLRTEVTLEQPEEYVAFAAMAEPGTTWTFREPDPEKVRSLLLDCGLSSEQATGIVAAGKPLSEGAGWRTQPSDALVLSIQPEARAQLYALLGQNPENAAALRPFFIPEGRFDTMFADSGVDKPTLELVRQLLYPHGRSLCFSDVGLILGRIPDEKTKLSFVKALTRQTAVIVRLRIRPDTDIDKVLRYWTAGGGARSKDVRPMLEALQRLHDGGSIGISFLLPPFARERLYTTPVPRRPGDIAEDCHWSTMNFFNDTPDPKFADRAFVSRYIVENYYPIARPSMLGDLVFFLNAEGGVIHSAVHVADDLVFTKNGENYAQPWVLTRMRDLEATYLSAGDFQTAYYRRKTF